MTTIDKITKLLNQNNVDQQQLAIHLGLPKGIVYDWKKGRSHSYRKYLVEISDFLQVPVEYLLNDSDTDINEGKKSESSESVNIVNVDSTAKELLDAYYTLSLKNKSKVISFVCQLKDNQSE